MTQRDLDMMLAGYERGLVFAPLTISDVGLSREQLVEKYMTRERQEIRSSEDLANLEGKHE